MHKLDVILWKEDGEFAKRHANIHAVPSTGLETVAAAAAAITTGGRAASAAPHHTKLTGEEDAARAASEGGIGGVSSAGGILTRVLDTAGCQLELQRGDVIFWSEDVFHRTQNALATRVALLMNVV